MMKPLNCFLVAYSVCTLLIGYPLVANQISYESLSKDLPEKALRILESEGIAFRYDRTNRGILLIPNHSILASVQEQNDELAPDVRVEGLYLIPYPDDIEGINLEVYNMTRQVSALSDVMYFSARRKTLTPLFNKVYHIKDIQSKKRLSDPIVEEIPPFDSILMHMKETNLGTAYYETQYMFKNETLRLVIKNVTPLRFLFKLVDKENMIINIVTFPTERGYLVYGYCGVRLSNPKLVFKMMDPFSGFYKRLYAMVTWLSNSLHNTVKQPRIGEELPF